MKYFLTTTLFILFCSFVFSQGQEIKLDPDKVAKFSPYVEWRHGGKNGYNQWKENNKLLYAQEMWYYSESFSVKRNHLPEGITLNEEIIDISRYESFRKQNEEAIVIIPGFKDVLVLLPISKLIYQPH
jgi:hypothetical protein